MVPSLHITLALALTAAAAAAAADAAAARQRAPVAFSSMLIGGGEYGDAQAAMLDAVVALAGGRGAARIGIVAAASTDPQSEWSYFGGLLSSHGAAFVYAIPILDTPGGRANNSNPEVIAVLRTLTGVFMGGGDQMRIVNAFFNDSPEPHSASPALQAILAALSAAGGVMAGTSAGAESQTGAVVIGSGDSFDALLYGASPWFPGDPDDDTPGNLTDFAPGGLGTFPYALVDGHFAQRGRQGRLLRLLLDTRDLPTGRAIAVGIDEDTALLTSPSGHATVLGAGAVLLIDATNATTSSSEAPWSVMGVRTSRLTAGDTLDFASLTVTPAAWKQPLAGREHRASANSSDDIFKEQAFEFEAVATSLVDAREDMAAWGATRQTTPLRYNVSFDKSVPGAAGYDGTDPATGQYAISYVRLGLAVAPVLSEAQAPPPAVVSFFVAAVGGDDSRDGRSPATAWASPGRALAAITFMRQGGPLLAPVEVNLLDGVHFLAETLTLASDSGGSGANTVTFLPFARAPGAVTISAGRPLSLVKWAPLAAPRRYAATLDNSTWPQVFVRQLFAPDGAGGYVRRFLSETPVMQYESIVYGDRNATVTVSADSPLLALAPGALAGAYVVLYHTWTSSVSPLLAWNAASRTFMTTWTSSDDYGANSRFSVQNIAPDQPGDLLAPGTFVFDAGSRTLTYALAAGEDESTLQDLIAPALAEAVACEGSAQQPVEAVRFNNVTIAHTAAVLEEDCMIDGCSYQSCADGHGAAVHLHGARDWVFSGVEIAHTGQYAMHAEDACVNVSLLGSFLHDLGAGGVRVGTTAQGLIPDPTQNTSYISVSDSTITDGGHVCYAGTGLLWHNAAEGVLAHNAVSRFKYTGVSVGWTWSYTATSTYNVSVLKNRVNDIGEGELSDLAGIYLVGPQPGTIVDGNIVTNITNGGSGAHAFYIDQACSGTVFRRNIGVAAQASTLQVHYGMDNAVENNILAYPTDAVAPWPCSYAPDCGPAGVRSGKHPDGSGEGAFSQFSFTRNIVVLLGKGEGVPADDNATLFVTMVADGLANMTFASNVYWRSTDAEALLFPPTQSPTTFAQWQSQGKDADSIISDPLFADARSSNFTLLPGSPALARGFEQIDVSDVGPRPGFGFDFAAHAAVRANKCASTRLPL
jgi:cyanophycinase